MTDTAEVSASAHQQAVDSLFRSAIPLPVRWKLRSIQSPDGQPATMIELETPAGSQRLVLGREDALALSSQLRKAQTGPQLVTPPSGLVVP